MRQVGAARERDHQDEGLEPKIIPATVSAASACIDGTACE
jgi:hypothetical protein